MECALYFTELITEHNIHTGLNVVRGPHWYSSEACHVDKYYGSTYTLKKTKTSQYVGRSSVCLSLLFVHDDTKFKLFECGSISPMNNCFLRTHGDKYDGGMRDAEGK